MTNPHNEPFTPEEIIDLNQHHYDFLKYLEERGVIKFTGSVWHDRRSKEVRRQGDRRHQDRRREDGVMGRRATDNLK